MGNPNMCSAISKPRSNGSMVKMVLPMLPPWVERQPRCSCGPALGVLLHAAWCQASSSAIGESRPARAFVVLVRSLVAEALKCGDEAPTAAGRQRRSPPGRASAQQPGRADLANSSEPSALALEVGALVAGAAPLKRRA